MYSQKQVHILDASEKNEICILVLIEILTFQKVCSSYGSKGKYLFLTIQRYDININISVVIFFINFKKSTISYIS